MNTLKYSNPFQIKVILPRVLWIMAIVMISLNAFSQSTGKRVKNSPMDDAMKVSNTNVDSAMVIWKGAEAYARNNVNKGELSYWYYIGAHLFRLKNDKDNFFLYGKLAQRDYQNSNDILGLSMVYLVYGNMYLEDFALDSAKYYFTKSLEIKKEINDEEGLGIVLSNLGTVEDYSGNFVKASDLYFESIKLTQKLNDETQLSITYHNYSIVQYNLGNIENAILYQNKAIEINKRLKNQYSESMNHVCLSAFYLELKNLNNAEFHAKASETLSIKLNDVRGLLYSQSAIGDVYLEQKKYNQALLYYNMFLGHVEKDGDLYMKAQVQHKVGKTLIELGQISQAIVLLNQANKIYEANATIKELKEVNEDISMCYELSGNTDLAFKHLKLSQNFRDTFFKEEKTKEALHLEAKFNNNQKELENQRLLTEQSIKETTIAAQRNYLLGGGIAIVLISLLSMILYRQAQKQKQLTTNITNQKNQIQFLNQELNHRVKNNLAFMTALLGMQSRRTDSAEAKQVLSESENRLKALALVHAQLFQSDKDTDINLKTYLDEIISYLREIFRNEDTGLTIRTEMIDYQINAEDAMRLGLIINESMTNSVKHAFLDVQKPMITIKTSVNDNGKLVMEYQDNGPGIETILQKDGVSNSLGLKLISLLKKQLGDRYVVMV